jgi:hypothetical protein
MARLSTAELVAYLTARYAEIETAATAAAKPASVLGAVWRSRGPGGPGAPGRSVPRPSGLPAAVAQSVS